MDIDNLEAPEEEGPVLRAGDRDYRAWVGPPSRYDKLLANMGLRESHYLLDLGCGSLRAGRLFIPFLKKGHYFGIEPEQWLVEAGIENELGQDILRAKEPHFSYNSDFNLMVFDRQFDFILAQSVFSHTSKAQMEKCLSRAVFVMHPSSVFVFNFKRGKDNYDGDEWVYPKTTTFVPSYVKYLVEKHGMSYRELSMAGIAYKMVWVTASLNWKEKDG